MSGKYLLDTNIIIALFKREKRIIEKLALAEEIFIPSVVMGELFYGAYKSLHIKENVEHLIDFMHANTILPCESRTANIYGEVKYKLHKKGTPIPENDIWISAIGLQHKLILVTRDTHFNEIDILKIEKW